MRDDFTARRRAAGIALIGGVCIALAACSSAPLSPFVVDGPPLLLVPAPLAGVRDQRARFREIFCAVLEARKTDLPDYRACDDALTQVGIEPPAGGKPVGLGASQSHLIAAVVPGVGWNCFSDWLRLSGSVAEHVRQFGYDLRMIEVDGTSGTETNARQIRDAVQAMQLDSGDRRLVLIGYSKGAVDILEALVRYPEIRAHVAAVAAVAGAVGGSALANSAKESQLDLLRHFPGARCDAGDDRAVESMRPGVRKTWLANNPLPSDFPYYSFVTYPHPDRISSLLRGSYKKLSKVDARNDSQVVFYDQMIPGSALAAYINADHWAVSVPINRSHPFVSATLATQNAYPREALLEALLRFVEEDVSAQR